MDERNFIKRLLENDLLRWKVVIVHFILFIMGMGVVAFFLPKEKVLVAPLWIGIIALQFIFTISNEVRREKLDQFDDKPKRHRLELGDDGELIEIVEDNAEEKRRNSAAFP